MAPAACICHRVGLGFLAGIGDITGVEGDVVVGGVDRIVEVEVKVVVGVEEGRISEVGVEVGVVGGVVVVGDSMVVV